MRASASTGPPAANGTTTLIGSAAYAGTASNASSRVKTRVMPYPGLFQSHAASRRRQWKEGASQSPALREGRAVEHFGEPGARSARRVGRQCGGCKETVVDDLVGGGGAAPPPGTPAHKKGGKGGPPGAGGGEKTRARRGGGGGENP